MYGDFFPRKYTAWPVAPRTDRATPAMRREPSVDESDSSSGLGLRSGGGAAVAPGGGLMPVVPGVEIISLYWKFHILYVVPIIYLLRKKCKMSWIY
jgi:hypothetical protein